MNLRTRFFSAILLLVSMLAMLSTGTLSAKAAPCYWAQFITDVTIPDGTNFAPNMQFKKTWRLKNSGACAWNSGDVSLIFNSGERMNAPTSVMLPGSVNPGQTVDITVDMTAPGAAGRYFGYWKLNSKSGGAFGIGPRADKSFWVEIAVTSSPVENGYDFTANASSAAWSSGAGPLAFPGADGSATGFGIKLDTPNMESGIVSARAGLLFSPQNVRNGYVQAVYPAVHVLQGDRFQATIGCEYGATNCYVSYKLYYQIGTGPTKTLWTFREKYEGFTYNVNLDLSSLANQDVKFTLAIEAYGSASGDRALWVNPVIVRVRPLSISPTPSALPDLTISSVYLGMQGIPNTSSNCVPNYAPYEIRVTIQNRGQAQAVDIPVVEVSTGAQLKIGLLRAGQSTELYFPATTSGATYNLIVDPQNKIPELDENNNTFSYPVVTPTPPAICTPITTPVIATFTPTPTPTAGPLGNALIIWQSADSPCKTASFWSDHMTYGYCPPSLAPIRTAYYPEYASSYTSRFAIWAKAYAPFSTQTPGGTVTFNGGGHVISTQAEQRMIAEWAYYMFSEIPQDTGLSGGGMPISGHFSGDSTCFDIAIYRDGRYRVESCLAGFTYPAPNGYLDANELLYFYQWADRLDSYQVISAVGNLSFVNIFRADGLVPPTLADKLAMETMVFHLEGRAKGQNPLSGGGMPSAAFVAQRLLSEQLGIHLDQVQIKNVENINYSDSCLGMPKSGEFCVQGDTPGLRIQLVVQNMLYEFHTDYAGYDLRQFGDPQPALQGAGE